MNRRTTPSEAIIAPNPQAPGLTRAVVGVDHTGAAVEISVVEERPLTIYLNSREIVTNMTIGDYPEYLAVGFLRNQGMLSDRRDLKVVQYDEEAQAVSVHTHSQTRYDQKMQKATRTSAKGRQKEHRVILHAFHGPLHHVVFHACVHQREKTHL